MAESEARRAKISIAAYLVLTFVFSSVFYRLIIHQGALAAHGLLLVSGLMWSPGIAGLLTRLFMQGNLRGHGWGWGKWKYEFAGYWIPLAYAAVVYLPLWMAGYVDFQAIPNNAYARAAAKLGQHSPASVLGYFFVLATYGAFMASARALGEELGWRGFLVPQLAKITSFRGVAIISGVFWSLWHYPLILFANYNGAGPRWYSITCFTVMVIGISFLFAWMRLKSGSVWPCMLLHASHNVFIQAFFDPLTRPAPLTNYMIGEFGVGLAIVAIILAILFDRKRNELPQTRVM
ncbi:MAG TPA: type II CAAX endopeptidase family protein [Candidatus Acidoferrales bacterium]|nr:type II CAAX endopeptidase family protein [Candidatus Acidoferrales bacterium]